MPSSHSSPCEWPQACLTPHMIIIHGRELAGPFKDTRVMKHAGNLHLGMTKCISRFRFMSASRKNALAAAAGQPPSHREIAPHGTLEQSSLAKTRHSHSVISQDGLVFVSKGSLERAFRGAPLFSPLKARQRGRMRASGWLAWQLPL